MVDSERQRRRPARALLRYALGWLVAGAATAILAIALLDDGGRGEVELPPLEQIELTRAASAAGCSVRHADGRRRLVPPVDGPRGVPARPAVYEKAPRSAQLVAAARRGTIVVQYRPGLDGRLLDDLARVQSAVPRGTILTPAAQPMPYELAVVAHRRLLGCKRASARAIDAVRLFRGRYVGSGPDG